MIDDNQKPVESSAMGKSWATDFSQKLHNPEFTNPTTAPSDTMDAGMGNVSFSGLPDNAHPKKM